MGQSYGAGHPHTLRCSKCKRLRDWRDNSNRDTQLEATGVVRALTSSQEGTGGGRSLQYRVAVRCLVCGHVMLSRHTTARDLLIKRIERTVREYGSAIVSPGFR